MNKAAMKATAKKRLAQAKLQLGKFKRSARKELAKMAVQLRMHKAALKTAAKRYKSSMKAQRRAGRV
jgi:hypothetical protein